MEDRVTVSVEPMHHLERYWRDPSSPLKWDCLFMLPPWLDVWRQYFGRGTDTHLFVVKQDDVVLGIAPLTIMGDTAYLVSDADLIDYSDFIVAPSREREFHSTLFDHLAKEGVSRLYAARVRADSTAASCLGASLGSLGIDVSCNPVDVVHEMDLPDTWEGYLELLSGRERHEMRRKLRRLEGAGRVGLRVVEDKEEVSATMDTFITLFRSNRREKAEFMAGDVETFFRSLAVGTAEAGLLKLLFLDLNETPVASVMCFDYQSSVYLYNNGFDRRFGALSVGLLSKVFSIRESIKRGRKKYNFLRGGEAYKVRLGGSTIRLLRCRVIFI